jgi:hypothetical protein
LWLVLSILDYFQWLYCLQRWNHMIWIVLVNIIAPSWLMKLNTMDVLDTLGMIVNIWDLAVWIVFIVINTINISILFVILTHKGWTACFVFIVILIINWILILIMTRILIINFCLIFINLTAIQLILLNIHIVLVYINLIKFDCTRSSHRPSEPKRAMKILKTALVLIINSATLIIFSNPRSCSFHCDSKTFKFLWVLPWNTRFSFLLLNL